MLKRFFGRSEQAAFTWLEQGDALLITLAQDGKALPFSQWHAARPDASRAIDAVAFNDDETPDGEALTEVGEDHLRLSARAVASLDSATSSMLGVPAATPLALDLKAENRIDQDDFRLAVRWVRPGGHPVRWTLSGAILRTDVGPRRVPEPLYSLYKAAEPLTRGLEKSERFAALAKLRAHWPEDPQLAVESEAYLQDLRVHYAASLSLKLKALTPDTTEFDPVLFSAPAVVEADQRGVALDEDADSILDPAAQRLFSSDRFRRESEARPVYVLRNGEYLFIDPALRSALNVVRGLQDAPEEKRRSFVLNPRKVLRDVLGDEEADRIGLEQLFIDTEQFSARVAGVDVWRAPVLPWIVPSKKNGWLPEQFGLRIGEDYFALPADNVAEVIKRVEEATDAGHPDANVDGLLTPVDEAGPPPPSRIPVNDQSRQALASLAPFTKAGGEAGPGDPGAPASPHWNAELNGKLFLVVRDNFEEVDYAPIELSQAPEEISSQPVQLPARLTATLKVHQVQGLDWLAQCSQAGRPGALLADDMGLGKTLQAIAFMAWLQDEAAAGRRANEPFLIVAPTGLLGNWRTEIEKHLGEPQLGHLVPAFGSNLKLLREEDKFGARDIETGKASLDAANWKEAGVVLTTFETLRDYHFSFARTRFGLVIYDEIQKLKNPGSQMTRAAMAINARFTLGMTGTPVENRLQDLWSIMNVVAPGFLGASRDFEKRHPTDDSEALSRLKAQLTDPVKGRPPYMLRRLKSEVLDGMPTKTVHPLEKAMPAAQANAYRDLVIRAAAAGSAGNLGKGGMLTTLAQMRGVSLHPLDPRHAPDDLDSYARDSARLSQTLAILEQVAQAREKALIFVEDLAMQERLAGLIQQRFALSHRPIRINGTIAGPKRQGLVDAFQSRPNTFDVMLLSPRAGGVGLTLTAANHVIHLSRWWNPAVEDQATDRVFRIGQTRDVHVYLPMAVHPDPALAPSSFDLRLNALIDRKRKLTQDLFFPPDAGDGELGDLFREVSLEREIVQPLPSEPLSAAREGSGAFDIAQRAEQAPFAFNADQERDSIESQSFERHADESLSEVRSAGPSRPILSLPQAVDDGQIRLWRRGPGEARPTEEILALFAGRHITQVTIRDPYALGTREARLAQIEFLRDLKQSVSTLESVLVEYAPEIDGDMDDMGSRRDFGAAFASTFAGSVPKLILSRRPKRSHYDDFHDRFVEIDIRHAGGAVKRHELTIGRGLEALYNERRQCTVTYAPPGSG